MNDFHQGFILAYFKENAKEYSFRALAQSLGVPISLIDDYVEALIREGLLEYNPNKMLSLTPKGRLKILNQQIDFLQFNNSKINTKFINPKKAIPIDSVYIPENFISKLM